MSIVVAMAGSYLGGTIGGPVGAQIGWIAGSALGNALFGQDLPEQRIEGPRLDDKRILNSAYGNFITIVKGRARAAGEVIWAREIEEHDHVTTTEQSAKGGPSQSTAEISHTWTVDLALAICKGPIAGVRMMWKSGDLSYNISADASAATIIASNDLWSSARLYPGDETQEPDPLIEAFEGVGHVSAYRGVAYMVIEGLKLPRGTYENLEFEPIEVGSSSLSHAIRNGSGGDSYLIHHSELRKEIWSFDYTNDVIYIFNYETGVGETIGGVALRPVDQTGCVDETGGRIWISGFVDAPGDRVVIDMASRAVIMNFGRASERFLVANDEFVLCETSGHLLLKPWSASALGGALVDVPVSWNPLGPGFIDNEGNFWVADVTLGLYRVSGVQYDVFAYPAGRSGQSNIVYDTGRHAIYITTTPTVGANEILHRFDIATAAWTTLKSYSDTIRITAVDFDLKSDVLAITRNNNSVVRLEADDGTLLDSYTVGETGTEDIVVPAGATPALKSRMCVYRNGVLFCHSFAGILEIKYLGLSPTDRVLGDVVEELAIEAGLLAGQVHASALTSPVRSLKIGRLGSARATIDMLREAYGFDMVERPDGLHFVPRGGAIAAVIDRAELAAHFDGDEPPPVVDSVEGMEPELPREVRILFSDLDGAYQQGAAYYRRQITASQLDGVVEMALGLTHAEATAMATRILFERHAAAGKRGFVVGRKHERLEPTDIVQLIDGALSHTMRVESRTEGRGLIRVQGVTDVQAVHTQSGVGTGYAGTTTSVETPGVASLRLLDIPLLRDADDGFGVYGICAGDFRAAELWKSSDAGASYSRTQTAFLAPAIVGYAKTALPNFAGGNVIDGLSTVDVIIPAGTLGSVTDAQMFAGANGFLIGNELLQAANAELIAPLTYRLSRLRRGRKGTEQYMGTHAIGDQVIMLQAGTVRRIQHLAAEVGAERHYKAPTAGQPLAAASAVRFTAGGVSQMPLSPAHLRGGRDASGNVTINANRRPRVGGAWRDYVDVPLGEATEEYLVEVWNSTFTTLLYTKTGLTTPTWTYPATGTDSQTTHYGAAQNPIYIQMRQVSETVGPGFPARAII